MTIVSWIIDAVARRDMYRCVAPQVDPSVGLCHDRWGNVISRWSGRLDRDRLTFAHVKSANAQAMGKKAPSDASHLLLLCWGHHEGVGELGGYCWGTSRAGLEKQRLYLVQFNRSGL